MRPTLDYPCGPPPAAGCAREVAPGVMWIRMPMPFALDHINLWAIADADDGGRRTWAIVDTGLQTVETAAAWRGLLGDGGTLGGAPVGRVLVTHMHPDHVGMAGWLTRRYDCRLWMTRLEYLTCRVLAADTGREAPDDGIRFYRRAGWSDDELENYRARFGGFGKMIHALPDSVRRLHDGEVLRIGGREWQVVVGQGHSPEHACLHCPQAKLLVSGDQVLPRISSNVSVFPTEPEADPLGEWIASIARLRERVSDDVLVLPAHGEPFRGLHARLDHLAAGHAKSLARLHDALAEPKRVVDCFGALFARPITAEPHLLNLATGETIAHLNHLLRRGDAVLDRVEDGVAWYRRPAAAAR
jgi:glyoxylase-like metal-dependent hydrolase (beta-lactamase superfamily II)